MGAASSVFLAVGGADFDTIGVILVVAGLLAMLFGLTLSDCWQPGPAAELEIAVDATGGPPRRAQPGVE